MAHTRVLRSSFDNLTSIPYNPLIISIYNMLYYNDGKIDAFQAIKFLLVK